MTGVARLDVHTCPHFTLWFSRGEDQILVHVGRITQGVCYCIVQVEA